MQETALDHRLLTAFQTYSVKPLYGLKLGQSPKILFVHKESFTKWFLLKHTCLLKRGTTQGIKVPRFSQKNEDNTCQLLRKLRWNGEQFLQANITKYQLPKFIFHLFHLIHFPYFWLLTDIVPEEIKYLHIQILHDTRMKQTCTNCFK